MSQIKNHNHNKKIYLFHEKLTQLGVYGHNWTSFCSKSPHISFILQNTCKNLLVRKDSIQK